jgi:DNA (cytosine-5)-methyltransferase 1
MFMLFDIQSYSIIKMTNTPNDLIKYIVVDLFAGAGGTTTGFETVRIPYDQTSLKDKQVFYNPFKVVVAVNHDAKAIKSHWQNHPDVHHFNEDILTLDMEELLAVVNKYRAIYPNAKLILWASLECTNFSKAKGGKPREADSRTLACGLIRYINTLKPEKIWIENVVEFMSWGPLDTNGKPINKKNGSDWLNWRRQICELGYSDNWTELNSANFGSFTSRNRLFGQFDQDYNNITWPIPTHSKKPESSMFANLKPWKAVKEVLDLSDEGESIFSLKKPPCPKTLERIIAGIKKFVITGDDKFIKNYYSGRPEGKVHSLDKPCGTLTTKPHQAIITAKRYDKAFMIKYNSMGKNGQYCPPSIENPCPTISTQNRLGIVNPVFMSEYYGNARSLSIENPLPTIPTKDRFYTVKPIMVGSQFIDEQFGNGSPKCLEKPIGALTKIPKFNLVTVQYLLNPQYNSKGGSICQPCFTLIASMSKMPPYLVSISQGGVFRNCTIGEDDTPQMVELKNLMKAYGIVDIKKRLLKVSELLKIQGFPETYKLVGSQEDQKKFIGNAVEPNVVKAKATAVYLHQKRK